MVARGVVLALSVTLFGGFGEAAVPAPETPQVDAAIQDASLSDRVVHFQREHQRSQVFIALLADPLDSNLSHEFDLYLTELVRGLELQGYLLQEFWFPWQEYQLEKAAGKHPKPQYRDLPGVLFFRGEELSPEKSRVDTGLVVLAVGETPSGGVQRQAIKEAFAIASQKEPGETDGHFINILGPTFSGTADSLLHEIAASKLCDDWTFRIRSGSATSDSVHNSLNQKACVDYQTQATLDGRKRKEMLAFLRENLGFDRIALLVESSTFGDSYEGDRQVALTLPFPMHISDLRSAYSKLEADGRQEESKQANSNPRLKLDLSEVETPREELPVFSPDTSATYDLVLGRILHTLSEQQIQAAGIVATNVKDKIFLADEINRHAPNIRLFTFEADVLLSHPSWGRATRGMLVASTHTLAFEWGDRPVTIRRFGNDGSQGFFEATVRLVNECRAQSGGYLKASCKTCHERLENNVEVQVSVVGRAGLYPVAILPRKDAPSTMVPRDGIPRGWMLMFLAISFVVVYLTWWVRHVEEKGTGPSRAKSTWPVDTLLSIRRRFCPILDRNEDERRRYQMLILTLLGLAGAAYLVVAGPVVGRLDWRSPKAVPVAVALATTILAVWLVRTAVATTLGALNREGRVATFICAVLWVATYVLVAILVCRPLERSLDLDSGVSPMLPILFLLSVPALWAIAGVFRCLAFEAPHFHYPDGPMVEALKQSCPSFRPSWKSLGKALPVMLVTTLIPAFYLTTYYGYHNVGPRIVRGIEDYWIFDCGITLLLLIGVLLVTEASCRCWDAFRALRVGVEAGLAGEPEFGELLKEGGDRTGGRGPLDASASISPESLVIARQIAESLISQVRNLILFSTVGLILILLALLTYPFEPDRVLALYIAILIIPCAALAVGINIRIANNPSLAAFRQTQNTWLRPDRILRVAFYTGVPALGIISSRFPGTLDFFINLLEPIFKVFS